VHHLIRRFEGVSVRISLRGSWVDVLCILVDDLDPSNAGFGLQFTNFGWNPRWRFEIGCLVIPDFWLVWFSKILGIASPRDASPLPSILAQARDLISWGSLVFSEGV
jgi:hypothetical protein